MIALRLKPHPANVCRFLGHRRQSYVYGQRFDRYGRLRDKWGSRCTRCGTTDGGEVYRRGLLEGLTEVSERPFHPRWWRWLGKAKVFLFGAPCPVCHAVEHRFGLSVGRHAACDDGVPF